jgi:hypothetical protein
MTLVGDELNIFYAAILTGVSFGLLKLAYRERG